MTTFVSLKTEQDEDGSIEQQFDAIELLLTRAVEFNRMRDEETLSECQRILAQTAIQATGASWPKTG